MPSTKKRRRNVPASIADKVAYMADMLCCACEKRGHQIHHIDSNPSNNDLDNLVLLCFEHHDEVTSRGGLSRKLSPGILRQYRKALYRKIEARREMSSVFKLAKSKKALTNTDQLFQLMLDAVTVREVQKVYQQCGRHEWEHASEVARQLRWFTDSIGHRARHAILEILDDISSGARFGIPAHVAKSVACVAFDALPVRGLRTPSKHRITPEETELLHYGLSIGLNLAYDGALYIHNLEVVEAGGELLWKILRYARINKHKVLLQNTLREFDTAEDAAARANNTAALTLLKVQRKHGMSGNHRHPEYPLDLNEKLATE
ncbi:MAG: HNH endonuclease [Nitrospirae bacterium]|nr:MAG: HNH endonuclease [Nitrospirota bacterium]